MTRFKVVLAGLAAVLGLLGGGAFSGAQAQGLYTDHGLSVSGTFILDPLPVHRWMGAPGSTLPRIYHHTFAGRLDYRATADVGFGAELLQVVGEDLLATGTGLHLAILPASFVRISMGARLFHKTEFGLGCALPEEPRNSEIQVGCWWRSRRIPSDFTTEWELIPHVYSVTFFRAFPLGSTYELIPRISGDIQDLSYRSEAVRLTVGIGGSRRFARLGKFVFVPKASLAILYGGLKNVALMLTAGWVPNSK